MTKIQRILSWFGFKTKPIAYVRNGVWCLDYTLSHSTKLKGGME